MTPEEIKASEDEERDRVTRISAVRGPRTASCPALVRHWLLTVVFPPPVMVSAAGALDVGSKSSAQYSSSSTQIKTGGWI